MNLINEYINDPTNPDINFQLAYEYDTLGQLASATTHYLKAIDNYVEPVKVYESLVRVANCFNRVGDRSQTVTPILKRAISVAPDQPEAYYHLARFYEAQRSWHDSYMIASLGLSVTTLEGNKLLDYPGRYGLKFFKAVAAWWIGNTEESRQLMFELFLDIDNLSEEFKGYVLRNINSIGYPESYSAYFQDMHDRFKFKFEGSENIKRNYSQVFQDLYILAALKGKRNGYYLEIGSNDPYRYNNTALLEKQFGWKGVSVDLDFSSVQKFRKDRDNPVLHANALDLDYVQVLASNNAPKTIDYLQVDCEPPQVSLQILKKIPFDVVKFKIITFEHDYYLDQSVREESREFLRSKNYELAVSDIAYSKGRNFEDWWVHPSVNLASPLKDINDTVKVAREFMFYGIDNKNSS